MDAVFPLGGVVEVPPLPDRSLLVKTLPEFAQVGGGGALGVVPPLEASPLENLFRCSRGLWRSAAASPSSEVSLLENQPTQYMTLMAGWRLGVVSSLSPGQRGAASMDGACSYDFVRRLGLQRTVVRYIVGRRRKRLP